MCPGNHRCAPRLTNMNVTVGNCTGVTLMPVCQGQCASEQRWDRENNTKSKTCIWHVFLTHLCPCGSAGLCLTESCRWSRCTNAVRSRGQRGDHWGCSAWTSRPQHMTTNISLGVNVETLLCNSTTLTLTQRGHGSNLDWDRIAYYSKDHCVPNVFFFQQN